MKKAGLAARLASRPALKFSEGASVAIENACRELGYTCPVICTPEELMGV